MAILRGGLIGCGYFANNHLNAWRDVDGAEIVAVCDQDEGRLKLAAEMFSVARTYTDAGSMLKGEDLDFMDLVTQVPSHRALVELVASHGVHAICQKPFAPTLDDSREMVVACQRAGVTLMVHENFRWQRPVRALKVASEKTMRYLHTNTEKKASAVAGLSFNRTTTTPLKVG